MTRRPGAKKNFGIGDSKEDIAMPSETVDILIFTNFSIRFKTSVPLMVSLMCSMPAWGSASKPKACPGHSLARKAFASPLVRYPKEPN
jgi:hypothetical protein